MDSPLKRFSFCWLWSIVDLAKSLEIMGCSIPLSTNPFTFCFLEPVCCCWMVFRRSTKKTTEKNWARFFWIILILSWCWKALISEQRKRGRAPSTTTSLIAKKLKSSLRKDTIRHTRNPSLNCCVQKRPQLLAQLATRKLPLFAQLSQHFLLTKK